MKNGYSINEIGDRCWYKNGQLHREDGPAIEWHDGVEFWYLNGKRHREDGPAIYNINGFNAWYYHGKNIKASCNEEFIRLIKMKAFW